MYVSSEYLHLAVLDYLTCDRFPKVGLGLSVALSWILSANLYGQGGKALLQTFAPAIFSLPLECLLAIHDVSQPTYISFSSLNSFRGLH